jgi:GNAT superfamily N-acetyltransferase
MKTVDRLLADWHTHNGASHAAASIVELTEQQQKGVLVDFLYKVAPDQVQFITGNYFSHGKNYAFAFMDGSEIVGAIRYCKQIIGDEQRCPHLERNGTPIAEAKINAFAVSSKMQNLGIGKLLQKAVLSHAKEQSCFQVASYSTYDKLANYAVKLSLGFCIQPETQTDGTKGCYFLMRL